MGDLLKGSWQPLQFFFPPPMHDCHAPNALDTGKEIWSVFFDLSQAFDAVPHALFHELSCHPVHPKMDTWPFIEQVSGCHLGWHWIKHQTFFLLYPMFLRNRLLGPLLHIANTVSHSKITMYVDNIAMSKIITNPNDLTHLQEDIISLCCWVASNYLTVNLHMTFSRRHPTLPTSNFHAC